MGTVQTAGTSRAVECWMRAQLTEEQRRQIDAGETTLEELVDRENQRVRQSKKAAANQD